MAYLLISEHVVKSRAWKGLSVWAQPRHAQWCILFLQRQEPDSTLLINADWIFSAWNYFTNGRIWLYSTFQKIRKIKQNPTQTHPFLLKASPRNSAKFWSKINLAFIVQQKWSIEGKHLNIHTHPFLISPNLSQPSAEELSPWQFKTVSGPLALVKIVLHARRAVGDHLPARLPHQVRVQERQHGDTTCGVSSSLPLPTAIPQAELVLPLCSTPWNTRLVHHSAGSAECF